jgi:hypothetical protein
VGEDFYPEGGFREDSGTAAIEDQLKTTNPEWWRYRLPFESNHLGQRVGKDALALLSTRGRPVFRSEGREAGCPIFAFMRAAQRLAQRRIAQRR